MRVRLCGFRHISISGLGVGASRASFIAVVWATVASNGPALFYGTILLSVLSVTLVYCGQTVGWIRMPLGMTVGLGPGDVVLDGDPSQQLLSSCLPQRP